MSTEHAIDPGLMRVGREAARRLQRSGLEARGRVRLTAISEQEIASLSGVLGARWRAPQAGTDATVDLAALDLALRDSWYGCTLLDLATALHGGALVDARAARMDALAARESGWDALHDDAEVVGRPALSPWLDRERATGAALRSGVLAPSTSAEGERDPLGLLRAVIDLAAHLPAQPPMSLVRFATLHCGGDPHALDRGSPLDATLRRALAHLDGDPSPLTGAVARRERYDRWGLACDELSGTVLTLGLSPTGDGTLERSLRLSAEVGEPRAVTLRELRTITALHCGPRVFTCENPDVVAAAADELGAACPPLICTEGWPSTACLRLLRAVCLGGATALHHGDMDPDGLRIVDHLLAATAGEPWRMSAADHAAHAACGAQIGHVVALAPRDPRLQTVADALGATHRLVREEQVIGDLLADLRAAGTAP